jgi:branched-chain amino acid transport system ATP-binding protein
MTAGVKAQVKAKVTLRVRGVSKRFGGLRALSDVSFEVGERAIYGVIGPNGAGKTTLFNVMTGFYRADSGSIHLGDVDLSRLSPARIAAAGIGRTFQNVRLFAQLTVIENLLVACEIDKTAHLAAALLRLPSHYADEAKNRARALELLDVFGLGALADAPSTSLPYGSQRRLEIARAMMLSPKVILLDEPAAGLNAAEADALATQVRWLKDDLGVAVILVEHNVELVMKVCDRILVLDHGESIAEGTPDEIRRDPKVVAAYLGEAAP